MELFSKTPVGMNGLKALKDIVKLANQQRAFVSDIMTDGDTGGRLLCGNITYELSFMPSWEMGKITGCTITILKSKGTNSFAYSVSEREYLYMMGWEIVSADTACMDMEL